MFYKKLKDLNVSVLGFGCWAIGGEWNNIEDKQSIRAIHAALDKGINFFDVAPVYGKGHSEDILGRALSSVNRNDVIIASKCGLRWNTPDGATRNDLSPASILSEIEDSLRRLQTDYIDIYQLHWPDPLTPVHETAEVLKSLIKQGKIRHVGVSNYSIAMCEELQTFIDIATYQGLYNLLEQNAASYHNIPLEYRTRDQVLPYCSANDIQFLPYSPLMQGLLTGTFKRHGNFDEHDQRRFNPKLTEPLFENYFNCTQALVALAESHGVKLSYLAMHWLTSQTVIGPVIAGASSVDQVIENTGFTDVHVSKELLAAAENIVQDFTLK